MTMKSSLPHESIVDAVIVGAGFAGLYELYLLRKLGLSVRVFDDAGGIGGTWFWNRYPGARTDSPSDIYQYFFSDELLAEWEWTEKFPAQAESERYLNYVADKFDLRTHVTLKTRVEKATWNERARQWLIGTSTGETVRCQYFIMCTGQLSAPVFPRFDGMDSFSGKFLHTSRWPRDGVNFAGKKVGVIGTGATGIQVIQTIAPEVEHLTVFQRTPNWALPIKNPKLTAGDHAARRARYPELRERIFHTFVGFDADPDPRDWNQVSPEERAATLERLWNEGTLDFWFSNFKALFYEPGANAEISDFVRRKIRSRIRDPKVAEKLLPTTYGFGTRRVPLENGYYETFNRDNVTLVDLRAEPIERLVPQGVKTPLRIYDLDYLIFATGFDACSGSLTRVDIRGVENVSLREQWSREMRTTLGLQANGYPNLFMVSAPFAPGAAFCNAPTCIQHQVEWISECVAWMQSRGATRIEPEARAEKEWMQHHDDVVNETLIPKTSGWYIGANVEGKPSRLLSYLGVGNYRKICDAQKANQYPWFAVS